MSGFNIGNIINTIGHGVRDLPQEIAHVPQQIEQQTGISPDQMRQYVHHLVSEVIEHVGGEVLELAFHESADICQQVYNKLKQLHDAKPDLVDDLNEVAIGLTICGIRFGYKNFYSRAEGLCNFFNGQAQVFAFTRSFVRNILVNTGPSDISLNVSGELFTSVFSLGLDGSAPMSVAVELVDVMLEKAGIPE